MATTSAPERHGPGDAPGVVARLARICQAHPFRTDLLFAVVLATIAIVALWTFEEEGSQRPADIWGVLLAGAATLPLAFRRLRPIPVLAVVSVATWGYWVSDYTKAFDAGILVALYSVILHEDRRTRAWASGLFFATTSAITVVAGIISDEDDVGVDTLLGVMTVFVIGMVAGQAVRNRRAYEGELEEKAARAQADAAAGAARAVDAERARIARELHDVVAHSMSVMVVQAGAARRVLSAHPDRAEQALSAIEETGRHSLTEMRRVLGILRSDDDTTELAPQPTLGDVHSLIDNCADAGLTVELEVTGDQRPLAPGLELAVYRIVQEALTNVVKHAAADQAEVRLDYGVDTLQIAVRDEGRGAAAVPAAPGSGNGLVGMRERVELFDGTLTTGPRAGGGYQVVATIPTSHLVRTEAAT